MTSYGRILHMSKGSGMHPPNVRWKLPQRHVSVSYGQFSLNRDGIAHWLHVHFAPLLLQNPSINFFLSLVIVGPINSLQCGTMDVKVLFMSGSPIQNRLSFLAYYEIYKSRRWGDCTFACASPISLSRKPLSLDIEATPKTDLCLSGSLVHRQTWRLTGYERRIRPSEFIFN